MDKFDEEEKERRERDVHAMVIRMRWVIVSGAIATFLAVLLELWVRGL